MAIVTNPASGGNDGQTYQFSTFERMVTVRRWLIWQSVPQPGKKPLKKPHYTNCTARGATDTPEDLAQLAPYHEAKEALEGKGADWGMGFALGADNRGGHWQGIDFDNVQQNGLATLANEVQGYVEFSPSGNGAHAIGYGRGFAVLGSNASGIEAYSAGRFFTVTENTIRNGALADLAPYVEQVLAPRHSAGRAATTSATSAVEVVQVDPKTVTHLRSALLHMRADDYACRSASAATRPDPQRGGKPAGVVPGHIRVGQRC